MFRDTFFVTLFFVLIIVAVVDIVANTYFLFLKFLWLDTAVHFWFGFWVGGIVVWSAVHIFPALIQRHPPYALVLLAVFSSFCIGVWWEIFQVFVDFNLFLAEDYVLDTVTDIVADVAGACIAGWYFLRARNFKFWYEQ
ncbi:MAG: hypothetical protein HYT27_01860 [Parcubacteria group bacterium]|nr:hypothetical protein [Parcubacteria group bacterium]